MADLNLDDLIDVRETCRILDRSRWTLIEWDNQGFGPTRHKLRWAVLYRRAEVEAFRDSGAAEARAGRRKRAAS